MGVIVLLIIVSVVVAGGFLIAFLWSVKTGQMEDDYTPSVRILFDTEVKSTANRTIAKKEVNLVNHLPK
ncbi:MAG: cbb3-type cytochrome oxidase assembly protein CcoS [Chitinophagia bacterium]|jgi:cbb3-type cytochrome oxidase maturation protein|nr:cbb3-type cytochrome oxidase assembly protein CcoS [Chitinophagia bacterium]